ncbi:ABC transporter ATP-binding protein [Actinomycetospora aeridis]|uniref:ABC transporter ATP-binding protein n=1 Tax=Actinomycetospora aeridis TaxID=3129231 RepID=A0ABU8NDZ9_9PSEU
MSSSIRFEHVARRFPGREAGAPPVTALDDLDLEVAAGELVTLVGPSGCGKSTLLDLVAGLSSPSSGRVLVDDREVTGPGLDRGVVFQQYALLPWRTARANVELGLEANGTPRRERAERAREYLDLVGLAGFERHYPHELSGGMTQRVAIARSLAFDPAVLLMDEPFAALDAQTRETLQDELLRIWGRTGKTILFITHGIDEAVYLGRRVAVLTARPGRVKGIVEVGDLPRGDPDTDVRSSPEFARARHRVWTSLRGETKRQGEHADRGARPVKAETQHDRTQEARVDQHA